MDPLKIQSADVFTDADTDDPFCSNRKAAEWHEQHLPTNGITEAR